MNIAKFKHYNDALSVKELKELLGIGLRQTYALVKTDEFKKFQVNQSGHLYKDHILKWLIGKNKLMENDRAALMVDEFPDYSDVLCVADIQRIIGLGKETTYQLIRDGTIRSIRVGERYLIHKFNLVSWLKQ